MALNTESRKKITHEPSWTTYQGQRASSTTSTVSWEQAAATRCRRYSQRSSRDVAQHVGHLWKYSTCLCWLYPAEKHLVLLRDGRTLIGFLRSIDQFGRTLFVFHRTLLRKGIPEDSRIRGSVQNLTNLPDPLVSPSQFGVSPDRWANSRREKVWRHPPWNIHRERRECGAPRRNSKFGALVCKYINKNGK